MKKNSDLWVTEHPTLKKLIMELKIAFFILLTSVSSILASPTYSQVAKISLDMKNKSLEQVMDEIERQSEFYFIFNQKQIDVNRIVDIQSESQLITDILPELFKGTDVNYSVIDRKILLTTEPMKDDVKSDASVVNQQQLKVSGTITDAKTGEKMPGVNIQVEGTSTGVISDMNGKYTVNLPNSNSVLIFTFIGYTSQRVSTEGKTEIDLGMEPDITNLEEVVVIGYGTARKATITGSVSTISGEKLAISNTSNFTNTLAGKLPGLVTVTRSGAPGADDATLRIRGNNTLNNNNPLIVVDGIANRSMGRLEAADIESVIVLKDASAAIYGAQAANGVILVTTKRGSTGKLKVNATFNQGFSAPTVLPEMANSYLYATMMNEMDTYAGTKPRFTEDDLQKFQDGSDPWGHPDTDWFDEVFKPYSMQNSANINASGGTENLKYYVSIGRKYQDANYRKSGSSYSQLDFRSNIDGKFSDNISFGIDLSLRQENRNLPAITDQPPYRIIPRGRPSDIAWWYDGSPGPEVESGQQPAVMVTDIMGYDNNIRDILESNLKLNINIPWVKGLSVTGNASVDKSFESEKIWQIPYYLYSWDKKTYNADGMPKLSAAKSGPPSPILKQISTDGQRLTFNALINYEKRIAENHKIKVLVGTESITGDNMSFYGSRKYFASSALDQLFGGSDLEKDSYGSAGESARLNYFGRVNYDFLSKYLLEFVWRYDGSYIFPADKRWGFFPGASIGWVVSEENFWKSNLSFLNYFKIRGSWGQTGNDRIEDFQYLSTYSFGGTIGNGMNGNEFVTNQNVQNKTLVENSFPNENVTWEVANQTDVGFDAQAFGGKLKLEADYFYNRRSNILTRRNASIPSSTGLKLPPENIGEVVNRGFEFVLGYSDKAGDFGYSLSGNVSYAKNKIAFWDETPGIPEYQKTTGYPMNSQLYYQSIGIFRDAAAVAAYPHWVGARPGDIIFKDVNEDGLITALDMVRDYRSDIPVTTMGFNVDLTYKNFYATIFIQGAFGKIRYHNVESGEAGNYYMEDAEGRWTSDNLDASKPRSFNYTSEYWKSNLNTYFLRSADYVRLKNVEVGYNFPKPLISKLHIEDFRIYISGLNSITWCPTLPSFDPESTYQDYPLNKVFTIGASLTF